MTSPSLQNALTSMFRVDARVALVTGAGRGIGSAIAQFLAAAGAEVILVSRTAAELEAVAGLIEIEGGRALVRVCDVTDSAAMTALIDELPRLDILVNNAGKDIPEAFEEVTDEHLDELLALNTRAVFVVAQAAVKKMLQDPDRGERGGVVINISSQHGHVGSPNRAAYCMTKHAVEGLTKAMAVELGPQRIRVNSIGPTLVDLPAARTVADTPAKQDALVSRIPLGHMATAADIAAAAVYLASPAAAMVTGTCLRVDGGWTAQ